MKRNVTCSPTGNRTSCTLNFWWKVSSESGWDYLRFYVDNNKIAEISGEVDWKEIIYNMSSGAHTVEFKYTKDGSVSYGVDAGWVDYVRLDNETIDNFETGEIANWSTGGIYGQYEIEWEYGWGEEIIEPGNSFNLSFNATTSSNDAYDLDYYCYYYIFNEVGDYVGSISEYPKGELVVGTGVGSSAIISTTIGEEVVEKKEELKGEIEGGVDFELTNIKEYDFPKVLRR